MFIRLLKLSVGALALACVGSCGVRSEGQPTLCVSIEPQRFLLERIAGERWHIVTLLERGEDPESFDPSTYNFKRVHDSQGYFTVGTLPFEKRIVSALGGDVVEIDTGLGIEKLEGTHSNCAAHSHEGSGHHSHEEDPHVWGSVSGMKVMAKNMVEAMKRIDRENAEAYELNYESVVQYLDSCENVIRRNLSGCEGATFMVWHPSLSYFAHDHGLVQLAIGGDNKELSVDLFRDAIDEARHHGARLFLVQPEFDSGRSESVAAEAGVAIAPVNTMIYNLPQELIRVSEEVNQANR